MTPAPLCKKKRIATLFGGQNRCDNSSGNKGVLGMLVAVGEKVVVEKGKIIGMKNL